jgi:hypothetical protein
MGTSSAYGGPGSGTPLVPTWLEPDGAPAVGDGQGDGALDATPPAPPNLPPVQAPPMAGRFTAARGNFTRFASSGGQDTASLGRAVSGYVSTASGGARQAARRMGSSRTAGANLLGFLSDVRARGAREALRTLNLEALAGRPIEEVFLGLADYICPDGGTVDEGIAREAFIETIVDLAGNGVTDLDTLTADQMQTVFELYATHAIEARLCNDIGAKTILLPRDVRAAEQVQAQLRDFIQRGVSDALTAVRRTLQTLTQDRVLEFVGQVYEQAFAILRTFGEEEATTA